MKSGFESMKRKPKANNNHNQRFFRRLTEDRLLERIRYLGNNERKQKERRGEREKKKRKEKNGTTNKKKEKMKKAKNFREQKKEKKNKRKKNKKKSTKKPNKIATTHFFLKKENIQTFWKPMICAEKRHLSHL